MKKVNIINGLLLLYLIVMSIIGWPGNKPDADYPHYFLIMGITLLAIFLLRWLQIRRLRWREKQEEEKKHKTEDHF
ncbi:MAG: hypothetical protein LBS05_05095 [Tannerellaceae bacterium]|jgi:hypothetical protein|nr:hypothetical protein [Tannerellaceae bacterium]